MSIFNFNQEEMLSFVAVLVRYSVLIAVLPFLGDRVIPAPVKVLFALAITIALFPVLVSRGVVLPSEARVWSAHASGIVGTIALEAFFGLLLGFTAKFSFDAINIGANLAGNFMGFATANIYDPHQESQTQIIAELQMALAMLIFLALDGHHLMLRASLESYKIVGLGRAGFGSLVHQRLLEMSGEVLRFGVQIAAPMALSLFAVNVAFGVIAKAMPQINILILSLSVSALVGFFVLLVSMPEFQAATGNILVRMTDNMEAMMVAMAR